MTKRTRTGIFYALLAVFFVLGGAAVLYAQGWRIQLAPLAFDKVGGIYVRTYPDDAKVLLNGEPIKSSARLFERGHLANNLFPGAYNLKVEKEGYADWSSELPVLPSFVSSRPKVVLTPLTGSSVTSTPISDLRIFGGRLTFASKDGKVSFGDTRAAGGKIVAGTDDGERLLTFSPKDGNYYWTDLQTGTSTSLGRLFPRLNTILRSTSSTVITIPDNSLAFLVKSNSYLRLANLATSRIVALEENAAAVSAAAASPARAAWTTWSAKDKRSILSLYDLLTGAFIRSADIIPGKAVKLEFLNRNNLLALTDDGTLYSLSLSTGTREVLARAASDFFLAPDGSGIAVLDKQGVGVISERDTRNYTFLSIPDASSISDIIWYKDDTHLFLRYPDRIVFIDLEDTTLQNARVVADTPEAEYSLNENALYAVVKGALLRYKFPD